MTGRGSAGQVYRVDDTRFGLPLSPPAAVRLRAMRLVLATLYGVMVVGWPETVRGGASPAWLPVAAVAWAGVTTLPLVWRDERRRSQLVIADFLLVAGMTAVSSDVLLAGAVPTAAVVALGALPPIVTRRLGPPVVVLVAVTLGLSMPAATASWLTGLTAAVVLMMERARHEAALAWLRAARSAAYVNRLQRSARDVAARVAEAAERRRPVAHDLAGSIGSIAALGRRLDRDGTTPHVVDIADRLDAALTALQRRLESATTIAGQHLAAVAPQAGINPAPVGWRLGGVRLGDVLSIARLAAITGFVLLVFVLEDDGSKRGLAVLLAVSAIAVSLPSAVSSDPRWKVAVHVNDGIAIVVAIALLDGLLGPVAPALVIHAALVSLSLSARQSVVVVVVTVAALGVLAAVEGSVLSALLSLWWMLAFGTSLQWLIELQRRIVTERRQIAELDGGRVSAQRATRSAARMARHLDQAFAEFVDRARVEGEACREIAGSVASLRGKSARVGEVLGAEASHLLELLDDLEQRATEEESPLILQPVQPGVVVAKAAGVAATEGNATIVDRCEGREVVTDDHAIEVCVRNLVSNALRHRLRRPVRVVVTVEEETWTVAVSDDGPGLTQDEFDRLTNKYTQAAGDLNTGTYGLGLWIVRSSVERLGGALSCERAGGWFTVAIKLPVVPTHAGDGVSPMDGQELR